MIIFSWKYYFSIKYIIDDKYQKLLKIKWRIGTHDIIDWNIRSLKQSTPSLVGPKIWSDKFNKFILLFIAWSLLVSLLYYVSLCLGHGTKPNNWGIE